MLRLSVFVLLKRLCQKQTLCINMNKKWNNRYRSLVCLDQFVLFWFVLLFFGVWNENLFDDSYANASIINYVSSSRQPNDLISLDAVLTKCYHKLYSPPYAPMNILSEHFGCTTSWFCRTDGGGAGKVFKIVLPSKYINNSWTSIDKSVCFEAHSRMSILLNRGFLKVTVANAYIMLHHLNSKHAILSLCKWLKWGVCYLYSNPKK